MNPSAENDATARAPEEAAPNMVDAAPPSRALLGLLLGAAEPVPVDVLAETLGKDEGEIAAELAGLNAWLASEETGMTLEDRRHGWELVTAPGIATLVRELRGRRRPRVLTEHARETLFIVMRKGPCIKAEIEELRRVGDVTPVLRTLRKEGLVVKAGKRDTPGKPTIYRATPEAFRRFPDLDKLAAELLGQVSAAKIRENGITDHPDRPLEAGVQGPKRGPERADSEG